MNEKYTFEFIEEYLAGNLPPEESEALEQAMKADEQLAKEVDSQKSAHQAVALYTQIKTREKVGELYTKVKGQGQPKIRRISRMAVAATVVFLVFMGLAYFFLSSSYSSANLVAANLDQYPDRITSMSDSPSTDLTNAMIAYNQKDFASAIPLFEGIKSDHSFFALSQLYLGISQLETGQSGLAVSTLMALYQTESNMKEPALWYLSLAQLSNGNEASAKNNLQKIVDEGSYQAAKAKDLLTKLNSGWRSLPGVR